MANGPPGQGRRFYVIQDRDETTVDVFLMPFRGVTLTVRGVVLPEGRGDSAEARRLDAVDRLAEDIRARYYAWCESAEVTEIGKEEMRHG